jgi:Tol biopolymer transport system component
MTTRFFLTFLALALAPLRSPAQTCVNEQVTDAPGGGPLEFDSTQPRISADGRFVAFQTPSTNTGWTTLLAQVYVVDRETGALDLVSQSSSGTPAVHVPFTSLQYTNALGVSTDGRFVLFYTEAGNLVSTDTNTQPQGGLALLGVDVFLRDRLTGQTMTPNLMPNGTTGTGHSPYGAMSSDGRHVAFTSYNPLVPGDGNADAKAWSWT